jgi:hypothetical protein
VAVVAAIFGLGLGGSAQVPAAAAAATNKHMTGQPGPLILDSKARPVWFTNAGVPVEQFQQETYEGKPALVLGESQRVEVVSEH